MSMFTLAISCLTTSNVPWFRDLTLQVPRQYRSLQHPTLLSPRDTSTTGRRFHFGSASSFFLELFLHSSPVAHWTPTYLRGFSVSYRFAFSYCSWMLSHGKSQCSAYLQMALVMLWSSHACSHASGVPNSLEPCLKNKSVIWILGLLGWGGGMPLLCATVTISISIPRKESPISTIRFSTGCLTH